MLASPAAPGRLLGHLHGHRSASSRHIGGLHQRRDSRHHHHPHQHLRRRSSTKAFLDILPDDVATRDDEEEPEGVEPVVRRAAQRVGFSGDVQPLLAALRAHDVCDAALMAELSDGGWKELGCFSVGLAAACRAAAEAGPPVEEPLLLPASPFAAASGGGRLGGGGGGGGGGIDGGIDGGGGGAPRARGRRPLSHWRRYARQLAAFPWRHPSQAVFPMDHRQLFKDTMLAIAPAEACQMHLLAVAEMWLLATALLMGSLVGMWGMAPEGDADGTRPPPPHGLLVAHEALCCAGAFFSLVAVVCHSIIIVLANAVSTPNIKVWITASMAFLQFVEYVTAAVIFITAGAVCTLGWMRLQPLVSTHLATRGLAFSVCAGLFPLTLFTAAQHISFVSRLAMNAGMMSPSPCALNDAKGQQLGGDAAGGAAGGSVEHSAEAEVFRRAAWLSAAELGVEDICAAVHATAAASAGVEEGGAAEQPAAIAKQGSGPIRRLSALYGGASAMRVVPEDVPKAKASLPPLKSSLKVSSLGGSRAAGAAAAAAAATAVGGSRASASSDASMQRR